MTKSARVGPAYILRDGVMLKLGNGLQKLRVQKRDLIPAPKESTKKKKDKSEY